MGALDIEMPPPPTNDAGRPRWPHKHQSKLTAIDTEFLGFGIDALMFTEISIWHWEQAAPQTWKIQPNRRTLERWRANPRMASQLARACEINGYNDDEWSGAPEWMDVREAILSEIFGRTLVGVNVYQADIRRIEQGIWPESGWLCPYHLDLQDLGKVLGLKKTNLDALCEHFGIEGEGVHRAEGGCRRVRAVAEAMLGV